MLLSEKLRQEKFSGSQQAVVDFLLESPESIENMTIRQIAEKTYSSNATCIRIAHKLGFSGWDGFKEAYLKEQDYLQTSFSDLDVNFPFDKSDSIKSITAKVAELKMESINDTMLLQNSQDLQMALKILCEADIVTVAASHNLKIIAELFVLKLGRIHKRAWAPELNGEIKYTGFHLDEDSCLLALSYSGEQEMLLERVREAKDAGVPIIAVTSIGNSTLADLADVTLRICTREKMYSKISWYTTESAFDYVLDVLYSLLFQVNYDENIRFKLSASKRIEKDRMYASGIIAENEEHLK